jgi:hypothetical protein
MRCGDPECNRGHFPCAECHGGRDPRRRIVTIAGVDVDIRGLDAVLRRARDLSCVRVRSALGALYVGSWRLPRFQLYPGDELIDRHGYAHEQIPLPLCA